MLCLSQERAPLNTVQNINQAFLISNSSTGIASARHFNHLNLPALLNIASVDIVMICEALLSLEEKHFLPYFTLLIRLLGMWLLEMDAGRRVHSLSSQTDKGIKNSEQQYNFQYEAI